MVAGGDPRAADFDLARGDAIPRGFSGFAFGAFRAHQADLDKRRRPALFGADFVFFVFGPVAHVRPESAGSADGGGLGHTPEMLDLQAETVEAADELERRRRASTDDADGCIKFPAARFFFKCFEDGNPDGGDTTSDSYAFTDHQAKHAFRIDVWAGENQARAEHGAGERQSPGVGMEHGRDGQDGVEMAHAEYFAEATSKGVQHQGTVGIDDAFGMAGRARREAHGRAVVFIDLRISEIVSGFREQLLVVQQSFGYAPTTIRNDNHFFERRVGRELLVNRQEHIVNQQEAVAGMLGDGGNFLGTKPKVQSMEDAAGTGNAEECFEMAGVVPHHGGHAVAGLQSEFRQSRREPTRAPIEFAITRARDGPIRFAGDDLDARKNLPGTLQDGGQRERKIHHGAAHKTFRAGNKFRASYHFFFRKGKGAAEPLRAIRPPLRDNFSCKRG